MLPEISLNILDITQNSISAEASLIEIEVMVNTEAGSMDITIADDGKGMTKEQVEQVTDPFFTTRTTRKVGLGIPFLMQAARATGGTFSIESKPGEGTIIRAGFNTKHIDCMPLGDVCGTIHTLVIMNESIAMRFLYRYDKKEFVLDTRELKEILGDVSFQEPEVSKFIYEFLKENKTEVEK